MKKRRVPFFLLFHQGRKDISDLMGTTAVQNTVQQAEILRMVPEGRFQTKYIFPKVLLKLSEEYGRQMHMMLKAQSADRYTAYLIGRYGSNLMQLGKANLQEQQKLNQSDIHLFVSHCKAKFTAKEQELQRVDKQLEHIQAQLEQLKKEEEK